MAFVKVKQPLIPHFSKLQRQPAALHTKIIRKLLAGERNVELIAAAPLYRKALRNGLMTYAMVQWKTITRPT